ncbi:mitochondrial basic amino acids transporter isoform X2 [Harpegnathos saltator]|nr:mitochondrial basic amino acids transporter isoform X2 [Harpegnathos saltator]
MTSPIAGIAAVNAIVFGVYGQTQRHMPEPDRLFTCFLAGASAGLAQTPVSSPIELAKTRLQLQSSESQPGAGSQSSQGPLQCLKKIYKREGYRGVFKGLSITFFREGPSYGVYFVTYEILTRTPSKQPISTFHMLLAGGLAGSASWVISYPIDVIKSRIQAESGDRYSGALDCLRKSVRAEGYTCLFRGLNSTIIRAFPTNAATFAVVTWTYRLLGAQPSEASTNKGTHGLASSKQPREGASKSYESFASKWNAFFDDISRGNGFAVSYYAASMLSISGLMPDNSACLVHNCRRTGCEHDALDALELREDTLASFESRGSKNDEEPEEEEEEKEDVDEQKQLEQPDWSNIESAINTCTCNLQRVLDVSKLCNT